MTLSELVARHTRECEAFNLATHRSNEENDALAESTFQRTEGEICRTPITSAEEALAAIKMIETDLEIEDGWEDYPTASALLSALKRYIERSRT
jgi:hypothetical protein